MKIFHRNRPVPSSAEDWIVVVCSLWFVGGLYLDGWAHNHLSATLETFFTPWHAVFYSGYFALAIALVFLPWKHKQPAVSWRNAAPQGYGWSLIGAALFLLGGIGDMTWHLVFGIEANIDALLSPTHLLLAASFALMVGGPLRAWYVRAEQLNASWKDQLPMLCSVAFLLSLLTFMTQFNHFVVTGFVSHSVAHQWMDTVQARQVSGFLLQSALLMGFVFLLLRRAKIVPGGFTLIFALNMLAMALMRDGLMLLPAMIVAGVVADLLAPTSAPVPENDRAFRVFSFLVPASLFLCYFLTIIFTGGTWWSVHMWVGSIFLSGIAGLLLGYLALPPKES